MIGHKHINLKPLCIYYHFLSCLWFEDNTLSSHEVLHTSYCYLVWKRLPLVYTELWYKDSSGAPEIINKACVFRTEALNFNPAERRRSNSERTSPKSARAHGDLLRLRPATSLILARGTTSPVCAVMSPLRCDAYFCFKIVDRCDHQLLDFCMFSFWFSGNNWGNCWTHFKMMFLELDACPSSTIQFVA